MLSPDANVPPTDALLPFVTQWGQDPIWQTAPTFPAPDPSHFPLATATGTELSLEGLPGLLFTAVGHAVAFDPVRQLWFCDIEIDAGPSYFPFVRMALARFQPNSVKDAHLSKTVLADYVQLAPERTVTLVTNPDDPDRLNISVAGRTFLGTTGPIPAPTLGGVVEVSIDRRVTGTSDDLGWTPVTDPSFQVIPDPGQPTEPLLWSGQVVLGSGPRAPGQFRILIKEFESLAADAPSQSPPFQLVNRLVFADAILV